MKDSGCRVKCAIERNFHHHPVPGDLGLGEVAARIIEVDHNTPAEKLFDLLLFDPDGRIQVYRSERIPSLYPVVPDVCANRWSDDVVVTNAKGGKQARNEVVSHEISGRIVGGASAYGPNATRIEFRRRHASSL